MKNRFFLPHITIRCKISLCLLLVMLYGIPVNAMESKILFNRLDVNDGLSSNEISCIYKDKTGFLWFGTGSGLTRYDGYEFRNFRHDINGSLFSEEYVIRITETIDGKLWITYQDGKISIFDYYKNCFYTLEEITPALQVSQPIFNVFQDKDCQLLYSTKNNGLYVYDYQSAESVFFLENQMLGNVCDLYQNGDILYLIYYSGIIEAVDVVSQKTLFREDYLKKIPHSKRFNLFVDSEGELWIYLDPENYDGLYRFSPKNEKWEHYTTYSPVALTSSMIRAVEEDVAGNIWIATDHGGINILNKKKETVSYIKNDPFNKMSISQNSVICLYKDDTGILWCGTYKSGVNYYHESIFKFTTIRYPVFEAEDAGINDCNCVYEDASGNLWIGTNGNGLLHYNRRTGQYRKYQHNPNNPESISSNIIVCITGDQKGNLWLGTYMGGLECFDGKSFTHYQPGRKKGEQFPSSSIYSLYADEDNNLWVGTLGGGLNRLNLKTDRWSHYGTSDLNNPLLSDNIYSLSKGRKNELLIGTALGINILDVTSGKITSFSGTKESSRILKDKAINTVLFDIRGLLWVGTNNGLIVYDTRNDRFYQLDKTTGLPDNHIMSIMEDDMNTLWVGTKNGLLKIALESNDKNKQYHFHCTAYYENEGVQGRIFNRNSSYRTSFNELIFGGTGGLTVFNPAHIKYNSYPPRPVVTGFFLQNQFVSPGEAYRGSIILEDDISYTKELILSYEERSFTLNISGLNYFLPSKGKLSFIMEGFDKNWTTIDAANRTITYTNLSPGSYTFTVKAENNDGMWSQEPTSLRILIRPPFWKTGWAMVLYGLVIALLIYSILKTMIRVQKKKFEKEQERIAVSRLHEMDEMKLRFFTNVSHEFRTPLSLIIAPVEKLLKGEENPDNKKILKLIYDNANQLLSLVNQLLDFRKIDVQGVRLLLSYGDIVLFIRNITYSFKDLSEQKNIRYSFSTTFSSLMMKFDTDKVFKIVSNLLSNAFKFTPEGGEIAVNLQMHQNEEEDSRLLIQISDTGIGIAPNEQELIFNRFYQSSNEGQDESLVGTGIGLHLCREFVKLHNGTITVKSELGKGSTFTVALPVQLPEIEEIISTPKTTGQDENDTAETLNEDGRATLLVVDDNTKFREFMALSLQEFYHVLTAGDGEQAWQIILDKLPDMIISDVMMPVTDGIVLCRRVKQDIRTSHIPVILLTAKSADASKLAGLEAGADYYIGKPFNMDMLLLKTQHLIELKNRLQKQFMQSANTGIQLTEMNISSLDEELMKKAIAFIEEQMANPELSVEWLSREMGMSRVNFYKKTLSITGKTPVELIRTIRMKHAALLLEKTQMRVNEVAFSVGINDNKLFRKYFKEEFGVLPSDYGETRK